MAFAGRREQTEAVPGSGEHLTDTANKVAIRGEASPRKQRLQLADQAIDLPDCERDLLSVTHRRNQQLSTTSWRLTASSSAAGPAEFAFGSAASPLLARSAAASC